MGRIGRCIVAMAVTVIAGSFLTPLVYLATLTSSRGHAVEQEIARIRRCGEPVTRADIDAKRVPDERNAAVVYAKCFPKLPRPYGYGGGEAIRNLMRPYRNDDERVDWGRARQYMRQYEAVLLLAEQAAALPECRFPPDKNSYRRTPWSNHWQSIRRLQRLAAVQARVDAHFGDSEAAARHIALAFRIADALKSEPDVTSQRNRLTGISSAASALNDCVPAVHFSESEARRLADVISRVDVRDCARSAMLGERIAGLDTYARIYRGDIPSLEPDSAGLATTVKRICTSPLGRGWLYSDQLFFLNRMKRLLSLSHTPYRSLVLNDIYEQKKPPRYAMFASFMLPRMDMWRESDRESADISGTVILLGLVAYHNRFGQYPSTLAELKEKMDWKLRDDPFSGRPFAYRRQGRGFILYSVGDDLRDNGGAASVSVGVGDIVWKLSK